MQSVFLVNYNMYKPTFNMKRPVLVFHHFGNKGYSLFACLGREVVCSVLSVATLTFASAESVATAPVVSDSTATTTAREMLRLKEDYEENASHGGGAEKQLHVGIEHTLARSLLPHILPRYLRSHRDTYVRITEESPDALEKAVTYEGVDLVIGSIHNPPSSYKTVPLCKKEQLLVV